LFTNDTRMHRTRSLAVLRRAMRVPLQLVARDSSTERALAVSAAIEQLLQRLGNPHAGSPPGPVQSRVVSQRIYLAARYCYLRCRHFKLRRLRVGRADPRRDLRGGASCRDAAGRTLLWLPADRRTGGGPLSGRLSAAGMVRWRRPCNANGSAEYKQQGHGGTKPDRAGWLPVLVVLFPGAL
jgi:hypothetical protein